MAISLIIDTAGGANFLAYPLRNVGTLHVGGSGLPTAGYVGQFTGALLVIGNLRIEGTTALVGAVTLTGAITVGGLINGQTISAAANFTGTMAVAGAVNLAGTLVVTDVATFADGSVVAPGIAFASDTDLGIRRSAVNTGVLVSGGVNLFTWTPSGVIVAGTLTVNNAASFGSTLAVTGTSTLTGNVAVGGSTVAGDALRIVSSALSGASQNGLVAAITATSAATTAGRGVYGRVDTAAAAFTMASAYALYAAAPQKGAGSTITTAYGLYVEAQTAAGTNYAIYTNAGLVRFGGDVIASTIRQETSDGTDNSLTSLVGGGASALSRGAVLNVYGNEHATNPGNIYLLAGDVAGGNILFSTGAVERMRLNASGNLGFGTNDIEAWDAAYRAFQLGSSGALMFGAALSNLQLGDNFYYDGTAKYRTTAAASRYIQQSGQHSFEVAVSGTINTAITWTTALIINNAGNLGIGTTDIEAWSGGTAIQLGATPALFFGTGIQIIDNAYFDGAYKYRTTAAASQYVQGLGTHSFEVAPSGAINTAVPWTTALTIVASDLTDPVSIMVGGVLKQVTEGVNDSGGLGFKTLRVPN